MGKAKQKKDKQRQERKAQLHSPFASLRPFLDRVRSVAQALSTAATDEDERRVLVSARRLMDDVHELQADWPHVVSQREATAHQLRDFEQWLEAQGVQGVGEAWRVDKVSDEEGRGVVAANDIADGDVVMKVPLSAMLTSESQGTTTHALLSSPQLANANPTIRLACLLLAEANLGAESRLAPYVAVLPRSYSVPLAMSMSELLLLDRTYARPIATRSLVAALSHYTQIVSALQDLHNKQAQLSLPPNLTLQDFLWAMCTVVTRQNNVRPTTLAMVPAFDMVNHEAGEPSSEFVDADSVLVLRAKRAFASGTQVYMSYGNRDATHMLAYSGFVPNDATTASVSLPLVLLAEGDPLHAARLSLLRSVGIPARLQQPPPDHAVQASAPGAESRPLVQVATTQHEPGAHVHADLGGDMMLFVVGIGVMDKPQLLATMKAIGQAEGEKEVGDVLDASVIARAKEAMRELARAALGRYGGGGKKGEGEGQGASKRERPRKAVVEFARRLKEAERATLRELAGDQ